ncbi:MAG: hypothetical protein JJT78_08105 [Leptospira sp.]|nr:hypothetical protein [Leptospira sp.]
MDNIFVDGLGSTLGFSLFSLLDNYPALKNAMTKLTPPEFNARLNASLEARRSNVPGSLRAFKNLLSNPNSNIRETLSKLSFLIDRMKLNDPEAYSRLIPALDRIRRGPGNTIPSIIPIQNRGLNHLFVTKSQLDMDVSIDKFIHTLQNPDNTRIFQDVEDFIYASLTKNSNIKSGMALLLEGLFLGSSPQTGDFRDRLAEAIGGFADSLGKLAGNDGGRKPSGLVLKEFIRNSRHFALPGGNFYSVGTYNTPGHSAELNVFLEDLYISMRRVIITPSNFLKNPNQSILSGLAVNYNLLSFTQFLESVDFSLADMGEVDLTGRRRSTSLQADPISSIEHLFFSLSLIDKFGFYWNNDPGEPQILSHSGGILTIGDALHSLSSKLITAGVFVRQGNLISANNTIQLTGDNTTTNAFPVGYQVVAQGISPNSTISAKTSSTITITCGLPPCVTITQSNVVITIQDGDPNSENNSVANLGVSAIIWLSSISGDIRKNGSIFSFNLNTPALHLLEGESKGLLQNQNDPIYSKTIPWALGMISQVLYSGKAPYYNRNRTDGSGNILTLDGDIYRSGDQDLLYKKSWQTSRYSIPALSSDYPSENRWVGLGGFKGANSGYAGSSYTINEIDIPESERAVDSDEEAFYKNFQWLLYQKRMVLVIPVAINALAGELREAAYITIIGNGLSGLMKVKPFCRVNNCVDSDIGKWLISGEDIKPNYKILEQDLVNFSDQAGDSVFLLEVWGFGLSGNSVNFTDDTILNQVYSLLFPKKGAPQEFYGPIPPAIRWNFQAIERLGFTSFGEVIPNQVKENWNRRNKILPLIAALSKTFKDQADNNPANPRDTFRLLSEISDILARPYRLDGDDPTAQLDATDSASPNKTIEIPLFRTRGYSGQFGIRSPSMPDAQLYFPDSGLRSPFSILLENNRRQNDGLINLIGRGNFLTGLGKFLFELGRPENSSARERFHSGLQFILNEIRPNSEITDSSHINLTDFLNDLVNFIIDEVDPSGARLSVANYQNRNIYDEASEFIYDFLSWESPFGYSRNIAEILKSVAYARPNFGEITSLLDVLSSTFKNSSKERDYFITNLIQNDISALLQNLKGNTRELVGLLEGLTRPGGFLGWFWIRAVSDYSTDKLLSDVQRFLVSPEIQTRDRGPNDLFYSVGVFLGLFADLADKPKIPGGMPHWFPDHYNKAEASDTVFDRLNFLLSKK